MHTTVGGEFNSSGVTLTDKQLGRVQLTSAGEVKVAQQVNGGAVTSSNPQPVVTQPAEAVVTPAISSGTAFSAGQCIGGSLPLSGGFIVGAAAASLRHIRVDIAGSQSQNITATILSGTVSTASTVANGSATSIAAADAGKVIGQEVLAPTTVPGAGSGSGVTVYRQTGLDYVVPNGGQVVLTAGGAITVPVASGVTMGAGLA